MNVYEVAEYVIAADTIEQALGVYMEESNSLDNIFIGEPEEGGTEEVTILLKKLTRKAIDSKSHNCCGDDIDNCEICKDVGDYVILSYQDMIDRLEERYFPCVIAKEL